MLILNVNVCLNVFGWMVWCELLLLLCFLIFIVSCMFFFIVMCSVVVLCVLYLGVLMKVVDSVCLCLIGMFVCGSVLLFVMCGLCISVISLLSDGVGLLVSSVLSFVCLCIILG